MKTRWIDSAHCTTRLHCRACTSGGAFVESIKKQYTFDGCPYGFTEDQNPCVWKDPFADGDRPADEIREQLENLKLIHLSGGGCAEGKAQRAAIIEKLEQELKGREDETD